MKYRQRIGLLLFITGATLITSNSSSLAVELISIFCIMLGGMLFLWHTKEERKIIIIKSKKMEEEDKNG